jgi:hypothetical protein
VAPAPKRVFLSYAWESDEHRLWVKQLAVRLRHDGVDARLDDWDLPKNGNIPEFMNREVREADWVLVVCSPGYQQRVRDTEDGKRVSGDGWEIRLLSSNIFVNNSNKILAVLARGRWQDAAPDSLLGQLYFDLSRPDVFEKNYGELLTAITGTAEKAPPLGTPQASTSEETVGPLRGPATAPRSVMAKSRARWLTFISLMLIVDLAVAAFLRSALPQFAITYSYPQVCFWSLPVAITTAVLVDWVAGRMRARTRNEARV